MQAQLKDLAQERGCFSLPVLSQVPPGDRKRGISSPKATSFCVENHGRKELFPRSDSENAGFCFVVFYFVTRYQSIVQDSLELTM